MPLFVGGAILIVVALLSLSASEGDQGKRRSGNTILGAVIVGLVVFGLARAGMGWVGVGVALLWSAARRFGAAPNRQRPGNGSAGEDRAPPRVTARAKGMTREEALQVLGLEPGASPEQILAEYRRLMKKVHPDQGGTTYLATRLNEAKTVLLGDG